jgi:hypothetical protein
MRVSVDHEAPQVEVQGSAAADSDSEGSDRYRNHTGMVSVGDRCALTEWKTEEGGLVIAPRANQI